MDGLRLWKSILENASSWGYLPSKRVKMGSQQREDFLSQRSRCVLREQIRVRTYGPAPLPFTGLEPSGHTQDERVQVRRTKLGLLLDLLDALPNVCVCVCVCTGAHMSVCVYTCACACACMYDFKHFAVLFCIYFLRNRM